MINIEKIENGYLIITPDELDGENGEIIQSELKNAYVYNSAEYDEEHCEAMRNLLYQLMDSLEFFNSKHNKYRINIEIKKQEL